MWVTNSFKDLLFQETLILSVFTSSSKFSPLPWSFKATTFVAGRNTQQSQLQLFAAYIIRRI
jgi:hypothetical protein